MRNDIRVMISMTMLTVFKMCKCNGRRADARISVCTAITCSLQARVYMEGVSSSIERLYQTLAAGGVD